MSKELKILYVEDDKENREELIELLSVLSSTYKCNFLGADNKQ